MERFVRLAAPAHGRPPPPTIPKPTISHLRTDCVFSLSSNRTSAPSAPNSPLLLSWVFSGCRNRVTHQPRWPAATVRGRCEAGTLRGKLTRCDALFGRCRRTCSGASTRRAGSTTTWSTPKTKRSTPRSARGSRRWCTSSRPPRPCADSLTLSHTQHSARPSLARWRAGAAWPCLARLQGYLAHKNPPTPLGPPSGPRHSPTVGSYGEQVSLERGAHVGRA